jgi:hypothetical protein
LNCVIVSQTINFFGCGNNTKSKQITDIKQLNFRNENTCLISVSFL